MDRDTKALKTKLIYRPTGKALEYAELALNIYKGCTHGCSYCFNLKSPWSSNYFDSANPKNDIFQKVAYDAKKLQGTNCPEILISFVGDPYQPIELKLELTKTVISVLTDYKIPYTILTKGGLRAQRDFKILQKADASFGTTLVFYEESDMSREWEPYAPSYWDRIEAIKTAKNMGIKTWVSLEPVIDPGQAIQIFKDLYRWVDHWKVGKINHCPEIEKQYCWIEFREEMIRLFNYFGADYYIKKSLSEL